MKKTALMVLFLIFMGQIAYSQNIICPPEAPSNVKLAAKEIRRYVYLRTGKLLPIKNTGRGMLLRIDPALNAQEYRITSDGIAGGSDIGVLYGAYRYAELLGVRFYLHGDVIPDEPLKELPKIEEEAGNPLFPLRGVNSWGWHAEGMDAWGTDDYKAVITQLAKLRMNFIGIHCYPHTMAEPTVWHGVAGDFNDQGQVSHSYKSRYFNTLLSQAAFGPKSLSRKVDEFDFGASQFFEDEAWAPDVMRGLTPLPETPEEYNMMFNRAGTQFKDAFTFARKLKVKTCLGTETPLLIPDSVMARVKEQSPDISSEDAVRKVYGGTFKRIMAAHPLDYYWLWTNESWVWKGNTVQQYKNIVADIKMAQETLTKVGAPFKLATAGWELGPGEGTWTQVGDKGQDRAAFDKDLPGDISISAINRITGLYPVDPAFGRVSNDRDKWAIPWLECDNRQGLAALQLWAGMMRRDASDALHYNCTGLMGLHWRTMDLAPNISALAQAGWEQSWYKKDQWNPADPNMPRSLPSEDFYADFAEANFGLAEGGAVFASIDGHVPVVNDGTCPTGFITPLEKTWAVESKRFDFVNDFEKLREKVKGAGNLERFDYWLTYFKYTRSLQQLRCAMAKPDSDEITRLYTEIYGYLLNIVTTPGGIGMIVNMEIHPGWGPGIKEHIKNPLPKQYQGQPRIIVPCIRSVVDRDEVLTVKAMALDKKPVKSVVAYYRPLGSGPWEKVSARHITGAVWKAAFPKAKEDFEYYITVETKNDKRLTWPVTAPSIPQTVVVN